MSKVLILGGYGNFGQRIAKSLSDDEIKIIIAGRDEVKAQTLSVKLNCEFAAFDVNKNLAQQLEILKPSLVINTCGPFQNADYRVAEGCIAHGINYIDLADGRDFVCGIGKLDKAAREKNVFVISGASTVPGLSSAVLEQFKDQFSQIDTLDYGITPGQKTPRGLATAKSIITYLGKKIRPSVDGVERIGWQDLHRVEYPELGKRWMSNCDIPDLDLLPEKYGIKSIHFSAGMESAFLHLSMWAMSWLVRAGLPVKLENHAESLLKLSSIFDHFGSADGGMHMIIRGDDLNGREMEKTWFIIAKNGDGPQIPCVPSIVLAKRFLRGKMNITGAMPCVGLVSLDEYMQKLSGLQIRQY